VRTIIEPFRIKTVEPIRRTTPAERAETLARALLKRLSPRASAGRHAPPLRQG
jgi:tryptophanase